MQSFKTFINNITVVSSRSWEKVQQLFYEKALKKNEYFARAGEYAKEIAFLEEGIIRAYFSNDAGVEYNKHFFIGPCFTGAYASLITGKPNQIDQQALTDCRIWVADYSAFKKLFDQHPDIERAARMLAELFFVQKEQREIDIVLLTADKRYQIFRDTFPGLEEQIPQYHIASYLGITPTQLSRIRRSMTGK